MINQMIVQKQLIAHYRKLERVKPSVDTSAPKIWLAKKKGRKRGSMSCTSSRQTSYRSTADVDLYGCDTFVSGHRSMLTCPHSVAGDGRMSPPYYDCSGSTRLHTNTPVNLSARVKHERQRQHYLETGVEEPQYDNNDLLQRHQKWFRKERAFTPRTLQTTGVSRLSTMSSCYRNPKRDRPQTRQFSSDDDHSKNVADWSDNRPDAAAGLSDTMAYDTFRSCSPHQPQTPNDVPPLGITLDADNMKYLKEQSQRHKTERPASSSIKPHMEETITKAEMNAMNAERETLPHDAKLHHTSSRATRNELDEENKYQEFKQNVLLDVLNRGIFTNRGLSQAFEAHIEKRPDLREAKMRKCIEEVRKDVGVPYEHEMENGRDYGFRSTLSLHEVLQDRPPSPNSQHPEDNRPGWDSSSTASVVTQRAASPAHSVSRSPPRSSGQRSPSRPSSRNTGVGRPPLPRHGGRGRSDSAGTASQYSCDDPDSSPARVDPLINSNDNAANYDHLLETANLNPESDGGFDEPDLAMPRRPVTPSSARSIKSARSINDQSVDFPPSSARRRRSEARHVQDNLGMTVSVMASGPLTSDPDGLMTGADGSPGLDSHNSEDQHALSKAGSVETTPRGEVNCYIDNLATTNYHHHRDSDREDSPDRRYNYDDDADSCSAYGTNEQFLDTITEYQQKLEKTNFIDDAGDDSAEDTYTEKQSDKPEPVPQSRSDNRPRSPLPPDQGPESPSDSLDVSELDEDEYQEY